MEILNIEDLSSFLNFLILIYFEKFRHLRYAFVDDFFSINDHPSGKQGPTLKELLGVTSK